jgi:uncharacterized protein YycO
MIQKKTLIIIFSIIIVCGLGFLGYYFYAGITYVKAIKRDTVLAELNRLNSKVQDGDIIFQTSKSAQSKAIQRATNSKYSHMGIIYSQGVNFYVYEAVQPVKLTKLKDWISRGENGKYVVKRLINSEDILTPENLSKMKEVGESYQGKNYDIYFEWSDDQIYCSELVWKIYKNALGIEIGKLETLKEFNLSDSVVREKLLERYGDEIPLNELVISPATMFNSDKLELIVDN